ncbi:molybdenum cofactor biosysynthesis protein [Streptomyces sp. NPDC005141]
MQRVEILQSLVSPVHRFEGRPSDGVPALPDADLVTTAQVRDGLGIVGDRYFHHPAHRNASITLMAAERFPDGLVAEADLRLTRRNVLLRGVDIDAYVGATVSLDCGTGPVVLAVRSAARPCAWMDTTLGPGAQRALRARGGVRCRPLSDGTLTVGPAVFAVVEQAPTRD